MSAPMHPAQPALLALLFCTGLSACGSSAVDSGALWAQPKGAPSAEVHDPAAELEHPVRVSELVGTSLELPRDGRTVRIRAIEASTAGGEDCTVDLEEMRQRIDEAVLDADPEKASIVITVHFSLKYRGLGVCFGKGNNCGFKIELDS